MRHSSRVAGWATAALACVLVGVAPVGALAQSPQETAGADPAAATLEIVSADTADAPTVRLTVTAPRVVVGEDLPADAFTVEEQGQAREVEVSRLPDEALQVVLLLDTSGSMAGDPLQAVKDAALAFVDRMPPGARIAVIEFATEPRQVSPFSDDRDASRAAISSLGADGRTATYDAIHYALARFEELEAGRRVAVLLSDGEDNQSTTSLEATAEALEAAGVTLQVVELQTRFSDAEALRRLAVAGRGEVVSIDDPAGLTAVYDEIASKLLNQYLLEFRSESSGATAVRVAVDHEGVSAEASLQVVLPVREAPPTPREPPTAEATPTPGAAAVEPPPLNVQEVRPVGWVANMLASPWALGGGALLVYTALAIVVLMLLAPKPAPSTLHTSAWERRAADRQRGLARMGDWAEERIERGLKSRGLATAVNERLEDAGILLKPSEFVVVAATTVLVALAIGVLVSGPLLGVPMALLVAFGVRVYLNVRVRRRRAAFLAQLSDTLQLLSGSLRAGHGLLQAVDSVAKEADSPSCEEFRRVVVETRLGRDLGDALRAMGERLRSDDFGWVVQAIDIHRDVGGDLAEVLDRVGETIRARESVARQIRSLSAEGRLSAKVLIGLPFFVMTGMAFINPGYLDDLFGSGTGRLLLGIGAVLMTAGAIWISRLVRIEF